MRYTRHVCWGSIAFAVVLSGLLVGRFGTIAQRSATAPLIMQAGL